MDTSNAISVADAISQSPVKVGSEGWAVPRNVRGHQLEKGAPAASPRPGPDAGRRMGSKLGPSDTSDTHRAYTRSYSNEMYTSKDYKKPLVFSDACFFHLLDPDLLSMLFKLLCPVDAYLLQFCNKSLRSAALGDARADGTRRSMHRKPEKLEGYESVSVYELMDRLGSLPATGGDVARHGNLALLMWMRDERKCHFDATVCTAAASGGQLEVLKWARMNGCEWNWGTCMMAACNGHLEVLQWVRENGCPWHKRTYCAAAANGHLHVLQWARENGRELDAEVLRELAANGHLHILQWAKENGCELDAEALCTLAAENGHLHVLQWARENGCPIPESITVL